MGASSSTSPSGSLQKDSISKNRVDFTSEYTVNLHRTQEKNNSKASDRFKVNSSFVKCFTIAIRNGM